MTTATQGTVVAREWTKRFLELPKETREQIDELRDLFAQCDDPNERDEIIRTAVEILMPASLGKLAPLDQGVSREAKAKVAAYRKAVGDNVRDLRERRGLTQDELARKSGLPQSHISRLEHGKHTSTSETIRRLAKALRTTRGRIDPGCD
jgi:DNA-binding XRE family transcriptional regulator